MEQISLFDTRPYSEYSLDTLLEMSKIAFSEYYSLAIVARPNPPTKKQLEPLRKATKKYEDISDEIERRINFH